MNNDDSISFVREKSVKSKVIGHNKFQIQLEELNEKFKICQENLQTSQKLNETLQDEITSLKNKNTLNKNTNLELNNVLNNLNINISKLTQKYTFLEDSTCIQINNLENDIKNINIENTKLTNLISDITLDKNSIYTKYNDIKSQYQTLLSNFVIKSNENIELQKLSSDISISNSLYKDTNFQLQTKLDSFILEFDKFNNDINRLHLQLQEKDNIIGILHFKYGKEFPNVNISTNITKEPIEENRIQEEHIQEEHIQEEYIEPIYTINSIEKEFKGIKISSNRGLKISKRI